MEGYDDPGVFFSDNFGSEDHQNDNNQINFQAIKRKFKEFIRQFHEGNFNYKYRDNLKRQYNLKQFWLEVSLEDLASFDETLADKLKKHPAEHIPLFEEATREVADEITAPRPDEEEQLEDVQVTVSSNAIPSSIRQLRSEDVSKLVKVSGLVVAASGVKAKARTISAMCRSCQTTINNIQVKPGLEGYQLPRRCNTEQAGRPKCPLDPFFIVPDKCSCIDYQVVKLQEVPENLPQGEMPRHLQLYCDRSLCEKVIPGNRVTVTGIFSIKKVAQKKERGAKSDRCGVGVRAPYVRVVGMCVSGDGGSGRWLGGAVGSVTSDEEAAFRQLASSGSAYERISASVAPSIFGFTDVKRAVACLLFGGSRKRLPDGLTRRGDINALLLGDPGTAKSQLLKFAEKVSPIGVYTSGKGSSAAGLTASVIRDPTSRAFVMEGGAMVLADGGVVCIDEFDKMREDDRVAIHEAMEQQTISIAKAGITTTLNSRCSVLAAANSVFGRWDDSKGDSNIDFMPTILSRFDMIFIVKDEHDHDRDTVSSRLQKAVMSCFSYNRRNGREARDERAPDGAAVARGGVPQGGRAFAGLPQEIHCFLQNPLRASPVGERGREAEEPLRADAGRRAQRRGKVRQKTLHSDHGQAIGGRGAHRRVACQDASGRLRQRGRRGRGPPPLPGVHARRSHVGVARRRRGPDNGGGPRHAVARGNSTQAPIRHRFAGLRARSHPRLPQTKIPRKGHLQSHSLHDPKRRVAAQAAEENALPD